MRHGQIVTPDDASLAAVVDCDGHFVTIGGPISGPGGLFAINSGGSSARLMLDGANTFTGVTPGRRNGSIERSARTWPRVGGLQDSTFDTSGPGTLSFR